MQRPEHNDRWSRDSQFLYRAAEILLHKIGDHKDVLPRREDYLGYRPPACSAYDADRCGPIVDDLIELVAQAWASLYDEWDQTRAKYIFEDGYYVLFFLSLLWANQDVLLRGHSDAKWSVETTLTRWRRERGNRLTSDARIAAMHFVSEIEHWGPIRKHYPTGLSEGHREALAQHYGFPTDYLDFSFLYDIGFYFSETWDSNLDDPESGAIFTVPVYEVNRSAEIISLPKAIMRPYSQAGKFIRATEPSVIHMIEERKFAYRHVIGSQADGLSQVSNTTIPSLADFLFPPSDPVEEFAKKHRFWLRGEKGLE